MPRWPGGTLLSPQQHGQLRVLKTGFFLILLVSFRSDFRRTLDTRSQRLRVLGSRSDLSLVALVCAARSGPFFISIFAGIIKESATESGNTVTAIKTKVTPSFLTAELTANLDLTVYSHERASSRKTSSVQTAADRLDDLDRRGWHFGLY